MEEEKLSSDAFGLIHERYIKDNPARVASLQEELTKAEMASEIYDLREQAGLSRCADRHLDDTGAGIIDGGQVGDLGIREGSTSPLPLKSHENDVELSRWVASLKNV